MSFRWKVWAPRRDRIHPQCCRPRVRERDRGRRGGAAKAADRPDQTSRRTAPSFQLERPPRPPDTGASPDRPLKPANTPALSLVSALAESVDAPHFSSTTSKNTPTNIARRRCLWGAWRWNEAAWKGWMRTTHTLITFCGQCGERRARLPPPHQPPSFSARGVGTPVPTQAPVTHSQLSLLVLLS